MIKRQIKFGNYEVFLMKLYDERNNEIDLTTYDFESITLKGKKSGNTKEEAFEFSKVGTLYTDSNSETWIKFVFEVSDYEDIPVGSYICEIIMEKTGNIFKNLVEKKPNSSIHRFTLDVVDTYVSIPEV